MTSALLLLFNISAPPSVPFTPGGNEAAMTAGDGTGLTWGDATIIEWSAAPINGEVPQTLPGLLLWLDASDTSTIVDSGGAVSEWQDKSGNNHHAAQTTSGEHPITGSRTINSLNTLNFDGNDDMLELPAGLYTISSGNNTAYIVYASDSATTEQRLITGVTTGTRWGLIFDADTDTEIDAINNTSFISASDQITPDTSPHIATLKRDGSTVTAYHDASAGASAAAADVTLSQLVIGCYPLSGGSGFFDGRIAEVLIYANAHSNAERATIRTYLEQKWGLS